jgi:1,4-dihydroxy-2-naphthoate polyprenyltransferase
VSININHWVRAFRLRTLPLALASIFMGSFLAMSESYFSWPIFTLAIATTIFLQILSNLANDYGDSIHGADSGARVGPKRAVQSGQIQPHQMKVAVILFALFSLVTGIGLLLTAFGRDWNAILFFFALGILSILAAVAYTMGKRPYGYAGLGDFSVLIFFGFVGVLGSYYLFTKHLSVVTLLPAVSCGVFSIGVLNINNIRDIESDKVAGKYSVPVRIGRENAIVYHWVLLSIGTLAAVGYTVINYQSPLQWMFLITLPLFFANGKAISVKPSVELDPYLKQMAISTLLFVITFGLGLILTSSMA